MKQKVYMALSLLLLLTVGCANLVQDEPEPAPTSPKGEAVTPNEPGDVTDALEVIEEEGGETAPVPSQEQAVLPAQEDLPLLPPFEGTQAQGLGGGGGADAGFLNEGVAAEAASLEAAIAPDGRLGLGLYYGDVFSGTMFVLNGTLLVDIVSELVQQHTPMPISLEEATQIAAAFDFTNSLYKNPEYSYIDQAGIEQSVDAPTTYYAFDGTRTLFIDLQTIYYQDSSFSYDYTQQSELAQIAPKAEAFLQAHGLLTFEYTIERIWGNDIGFYRQVNGRSLDQPEISVSLTQNGDIISVSIQPLNQLETLGNYPLRSAAEAWQLILDGIEENNIRYNIQPVDDDAFVEVPIQIEPGFEDSYRYWSRTYQPGEEVHIYNWPSIFLAADEVGAPRIEAYPFILQADDEMLNAIAAESNTQYHFWGTVGENGRLLHLTGWEALPPEREPVFLQGTVQYEGENVLFTTDSGETYLLPNAPADLPADSLFDLFGWNIRDAGGAYPLIDWESIDLFVAFDEEPIDIAIEAPSFPVEPGFYEPTVYQQVTIDAVTLIYSYTYLYPEFVESDTAQFDEFQQPTIVIQPVWKFSGTAVNGDQVDLFIEAVAPEYFQ